MNDMRKKRVLIICTGNSFRSQMAEGFFKHLASDMFDAYSAGIQPTTINPLAIKVMEEIGIDISRQYSKSIKEYLSRSFDYIITVCDSAKQTCPIFPGEYKKIHWDIEDPAGFQGAQEEILEKTRKIRDIIEKKIKELLKTICVSI